MSFISNIRQQSNRVLELQVTRVLELLFRGILAGALYLFCTCFCACKKSTSAADLDSIQFSVAVSGGNVVFTNQTVAAKSYKWDFGDGTSSTDASPAHYYRAKGKYGATLTATLEDGNVRQGATIVVISKPSPILLNDNSLSDWDTVNSNLIVPAVGSGGIVNLAKFDYDGQNVYFYFEMNTTLAKADIFDFWMDTDNNPLTGYLTGEIPQGGYDNLAEGSPQLPPATAPVPFVLYNFTGTSQTAFSFAPQTGSAFYQLGTVVQQGSVLKFEGSLSRTKIANLLGLGKSFRFGIIVTKGDWSAEEGWIPGKGLAAYQMDISQ
jgi:PKD domain-containing protein